MGIFDNYLAGFKDELQRVNDGIGKVQAGAQSVVEAIDKVEEKVNNLPTGQEITGALTQKAETVTVAEIETPEEPN